MSGAAAPEPGVASTGRGMLTQGAGRCEGPGAEVSLAPCAKEDAAPASAAVARASRGAGAMTRPVSVARARVVASRHAAPCSGHPKPKPMTLEEWGSLDEDIEGELVDGV